MRSANWVAPTCPPVCFLFFSQGEPIGRRKHVPKGCFFIILKGWGLDFPISSQIVPIKFLLFPSSSQKNSHQIPLVPSNNPSKSFCSHQVLIKFLLFPSSSHQILLVLINNPSLSFCLIKFLSNFHQIPLVQAIKFFLFPSNFYQNTYVPMAMEDRQVSTSEQEGER